MNIRGPLSTWSEKRLDGYESVVNTRSEFYLPKDSFEMDEESDPYSPAHPR